MILSDSILSKLPSKWQFLILANTMAEPGSIAYVNLSCLDVTLVISYSDVARS